MAKNDQENEVKFPVRDLAPLAHRIESLGGVLTAARVRETNLRYDYPDRSLTRERRVLRLRQDAGAVMTYKGAAAAGSSISSRQEIEFHVSDFAAAQRLLEALGFEMTIMYEKYRTSYSLDDLVIVLDELPFGNFMEIEGPDAETIENAAEKLGLDWAARSTSSYLALLSVLVENRGLTVRHLSFDEFAGVPVSMADIGLRYADDGPGQAL